ncbi:alpha/beta fold hydrolase [Pantoea vagans]|uniref:alpha/beta fold hydrolase n=1 Tax=Pantoea vagans TaxID=470934 RepID=UPI0023AF148C|nr:alpha/beta hydrolase [Pantoea vagans]MDE8559217.1 alpha/beta hydrolase [Pantoea vagans]MDE8579212.1 alpha/beta hydrolase [Pantoea vagans]
MTGSINHARLLADSLPCAFRDSGCGNPVMVLHGGAGPQSVTGLADSLAAYARVVLPVLPGFNGEPRPDWLDSVSGLATACLSLAERLALDGLVIVGNSVGGWIAAEMALRHSPYVKGVVLINPVGIDPGPGKGIINPAMLPPQQRAALAFHDPARHGFADTDTDTDRQSILRNNQIALNAYAGSPYMHSPSLATRLAEVNVPALVIWGTSDGIVDEDYGRRMASSIATARFEPVADAGHFPHIEQPERVIALIRTFISSYAAVG